MQISDVKELKRQASVEECAIDRFAGYYVDSNKNIVTSFNKTFLTQDRSEIEKYLDIIKAFYSTNIGEKLLRLELKEKIALEKMYEMETMVAEGIKENEPLDKFAYDIIDTYVTIDNYMILFVHGKYDVIKHAKDGSKLDESEETYSYLQCIICPVKLEKAGLEYKHQTNEIGTIDRDWIVQKPIVGFMYPDFEQRSVDYDHVMYYTANAKDTVTELMTKLLMCKREYTITQKREFLEERVFKAVQNEEQKEDFLKRINLEFENLIAQDKAIQEVAEKDIEGILEVAEIPKEYRDEVVRVWKYIQGSKWPSVLDLFDANYVKKYRAEAKKKKGIKLLELASRELLRKGPSEVADEIEKYLETTR